MDWATATNILLTLIDWDGEDRLTVTLSEIRQASEELLETLSSLEDEKWELEQDLDHSVEELQQANSTIRCLQERPVAKITTGHRYHQNQFEVRRASGCCTKCGETGHLRAACPQQNPPTPGPRTKATPIEPKPTLKATPTPTPTGPKITPGDTHMTATSTNIADPQQGEYRR